MTKQTIFSVLLIIIVAVALFFGIRASNKSGTVPVLPSQDSTLPMGKLPAGSTPPPQSSDVVGTWIWKHNIIGGDALVPPNKPGVFSISFTADGKISGTTDCNGFGGTYTLGSEGVIAFGPFMSTQMFCEGSQEADFTKSLAQGTQLTTNQEGDLVIILGNTSNEMVFSKK